MIGNITFKVDGKLTTLERMREELPDSILLPTLERVVKATHTSSLSRTPCPIHGKLPEVTVEVSVDGKVQVKTTSCCDLMEKKVTGPLRDTLNATAYFQPNMSLTLQVMDDYSASYAFDVQLIEKLVMGRYSQDDRSQLDIDFNKHGGQQKGVSRRHAWIIWKAGALHLVDNRSANGTFLNGMHLTPFEAYKLHDKDVIRLGRLNLELGMITV